MSDPTPPPGLNSDIFKLYFARGQFIYGFTPPAVLDSDIDQAIAEAWTVYNYSLYPNDEIALVALEYLTAFFLQRMIEDGFSQGQSAFNDNSRSANGVSQGLAIPEWMLETEFAMYATNSYGQRFLLVSKPYLDGAVYSVPGAIHP